jgi:hypothetical protein
MNSADTPLTNLAALEDLLTSVRDLTQSEYPALASVMNEAALICETRHAIRAGINLQLQAALASIRSGRPEDATRYIEIALDIQARWSGDVSR